ncbi:MAG TPA: DUF2059 domain-containing protein [Flavobacterium sp.]|jgi:hypothetical protein
MTKLFLLIGIIFISYENYAQESVVKADVLKLMELSGVKAQMNLVKEQIITMVPKEKRIAFSAEYDKSLPEVYDKYADIYLKLYSTEDIKSMIAFYESQAGKKIYNNAMEMAMRSQALQQQWMLKLQEMIQAYQVPK